MMKYGFMEQSCSSESVQCRTTEKQCGEFPIWNILASGSLHSSSCSTGIHLTLGGSVSGLLPFAYATVQSMISEVVSSTRRAYGANPVSIGGNGVTRSASLFCSDISPP
ncbi:hypothetical protein DRQ25_16690 [Candidatus Fermentibacteria bacterium]|nr:MAG: hypothetical protein DRQ25_16690 [Candidatus Fermentibacteria bacterium]